MSNDGSRRRRNVVGVDDLRRFADDTAGHLATVLAAISAGTVESSPVMTARIEGAYAALAAIAADDPTAALDALRDPGNW